MANVTLPRKEQGMAVHTGEKRKRMALAATLAMMLAAVVAFGGDTTPCREEYLASGLSQQQMSFAEFRELYGGEDVCASEETLGTANGATEGGRERRT
jgi:hypothetical protein